MSEYPTFEEIAQKARVSLTTVSRVMNQKPGVSDATRHRVLSAMEDLGRSLPPRALVGLVVPDFRNPFFSQLHDILDHLFEAHDVHLITSSSDGDARRELDQVRRFQTLGAMGLVYVGVGGSSETLARLVAENTTPVVVIDRRVQAINIDSVVIDNRIGMRRAIDYLVINGHRRIAHVTGLMDTPTARERLDEFRAGAVAGGCELREDWIIEGDFQFEAGLSAGERFVDMALADRPTAVIAANDLMAMGVMRATASAGWRLPSDLSIIGFDDIPQCKHVFPSLTTVDLPIRLMAEEVVDILLTRSKLKQSSEGSRPVKEFEPRLIVRESVSNAD